MPRFPNPIAAWLRSIRYHSARRETTRWTRAMDFALFASPALGALLALTLHQSALRTESVLLAMGGLERDRHGEIIARVGAPGANPRWRDTPVGSFWITREDALGGWPMPTTVRRTPPQVWLQFFADRNPDRRMPTDADADVMRAIDRTIALGGDELAELRGELARPPRVTNRWALIANAALCWVGVYLILGVTIQSTRFVAWRVDLRRRRRLRHANRRGLCPACGYDLRASVWSERCPECGARLE